MGLFDGGVPEGGVRQTNELGLGGPGVSSPGYTFVGTPTEPAANTETYDAQQYYAARQAAAQQAAAEKARQDQLRAYDYEQGRLQNILGTYGGQLQQGLNSVNDWYNGQYNQQNDAQARALRDFEQNRTDTNQEKQKAYQNVDTNARTLNSSVRRILGIAGAGNSSAARFAAPSAISRQASGQRSDVTDQYGKNLRNIDQAEGDTKLSFENVFADLLTSKKQKEAEQRKNILEQEAGTYGQIANVAGQRAQFLGGGFDAQQAARQPYQNEIDNRQAQIRSLFDQYRTPVAIREAKISNPDLKQYTFDKATINQGGQQGGDYSPYAQFLKKRQQVA